jgi:hypothetical protein
MHLDVTQRIADESDRLRVIGVSALRAGPWMSQINELAGQLRIADQQQVRNHERTFYGKKADDIKMD